MIATLIALRKSGAMQSHHIRAAEWVRDLPYACPTMAALELDCAAICRHHPTIRIELFKLVVDVCRRGKAFAATDINTGFLREALNAADRHRKRQLWRPAA
jgi:hypothetical protein